LDSSVLGSSLPPEFSLHRAPFALAADYGLALQEETLRQQQIPFSIDCVSGFIVSSLSALVEENRLFQPFIFKMLPALALRRAWVTNGHYGIGSLAEFEEGKQQHRTL
jgi:hypothetical protein